MTAVPFLRFRILVQNYPEQETTSQSYGGFPLALHTSTVDLYSFKFTAEGKRTTKQLSKTEREKVR